MAHTAPMMICWFDSEVWQRIVVQLSHAEPAVYHTVVALSALHEDSQLTGHPPRKLDLTNGHHRFALEQYGKAISLLRRRLTSHDPQVRELALMCCINFTCFELFRQNYGNAFIHLRNGAKMLDYRRWGSGAMLGHDSRSVTRGHWAPRGSGTETALAKVFIHLDAHSAQFGQEGPFLRLPLGLDTRSPPISSIVDVKQRLDPILSNILRFRRSCEPLLRGEPGDRDLPTAMAEQSRICDVLMAHIAGFDDFVRTQVISSLSSKERRGMDVMRMQHLALLNILDTSLVTSEMIYDCYLEEYQTITRLAGGIMASFQAEYGRRRPTVAMDMGVIPSLFWVCLKCRHQPTRQHALELLESWPHREGAYDGGVMASVVREHMAREGQLHAEGQSGAIPESARWGSIDRVDSVHDEADDTSHRPGEGYLP
ncbi:uncharacterized protein BO80DRAFT_425887 [Aspergillus ibericus CBS 121593]|uniref:C6 zinc finger domain protein n=1 Tax=Aspergillus ibericus CBS 121593 TaxID=1448316 RepID=A0A395GWU3_9EURO|nr:hypothetical protein BO80DRAFT_425887 [Aspergillus ibericus CBS 121593]RAL00062.1 hypothetical protein BO80DRAFT_425887 [Aspergillus ibericus CBS 121593]